jgi:uncharacterized protein DUF1998
MRQDNHLRVGQVVTTFGPGSLVDLPEVSVIVGGLEKWSSNDNSKGWKQISEPQLVKFLKAKLGLSELQLRQPPVVLENEWNGGKPPYVGAIVFPEWLVADCGQSVGDAKRRDLVRWDDLDPRNFKYRCEETGRSVPATPIRFVAACEKGHIQDVDWRWVVHGAAKCSERMYLEESGTTGDSRDTAIVCDCGKRFQLNLAFSKDKGILGDCHGRRPWLGNGRDEHCDKPLKLLTRTATNVHFARTVSAISLPAGEQELDELVRRHWSVLDKVTSEDTLKFAKQFNPAIDTDLSRFSDADVFATIMRMRGGEADGTDLRSAEFDVLAAGTPVIGSTVAGAPLFGRTLDRDDWDRKRDPSLAPLSSVVAIHRLREVVCQYGFTRFEAAPSGIERLDDVDLNVGLAAIADPIRWLPAVEQFGEGIFIRFDGTEFAKWARRPEVLAWEGRLTDGHRRWADQRFGTSGFRPPFWGARYYAIHSLSHALIGQMAMEGGYPASSLKERLFVLDEHRLGLLIYTSAGDADGTLGGIAALAPRIGELVSRAIESMVLCSNDPICADHDPSDPIDERPLHGAACHGCLLIAETSCEARNDFLDRRLVAPTLHGPSTSLWASTR